MMLAWIVPLVIVVALVASGLVRRRIPRDMGREKPDDLEATLAYDRVSRWPLFAFIRSLFVRRLKRYGPRGTLLDAGCGPGYLAVKLAAEFPEIEVTGIDISRDALEIAAGLLGDQRAGRAPRFLEADINQLPLDDDSVDFIVSTLALHHWPYLGRSFREMYRVLKPQGQVLLFDLRRDMPWLMFWVIWLGQRYIVSPAIRRVNGGVGSVWASLTPREIDAVLAVSPFPEWETRREWGWMMVRAKKL